jgi:hypothetical protein
VTEVREASRQQAQGIEQVSKALAQMESVTRPPPPTPRKMPRRAKS